MPDKRSTRAQRVAPIQTSDMVATNAKNDPTSAASITRYLTGAGVALWALVIALEPDVGLSAPWPYMAMFWALQIGIGLPVLQFTLYFLSQADKAAHWPLWMLIFCRLGARLRTRSMISFAKRDLIQSRKSPRPIGKARRC